VLLRMNGKNHLGVISEEHVSVAAAAVDAYLAALDPSGTSRHLRVSKARGVR